MLALREYRRQAQSLSDYLPWAALVAPGVVLNKDGSFQRSARFRGQDLDSATDAERVATAARLNSALRRLESGWAVFVEARRDPVAAYPLSEFPDGISALVEAERRAAFQDAGVHYESHYTLTLVWMPPAERSARVETFLYDGKDRGGIDWREALAGFVDRTDRLGALLEGVLAEFAWLDDAETLTALHASISNRRHRVGVPETPMYLDALLADQDLVGGLSPRLGSHHLRVLTVTGFPGATWPGLLDELNRLAFPYRWTTRAICLGKTEATKLLAKVRRQWFAKRKSILALVKEVMTNEASALVDNDAQNKAADADGALQDLGADLAGYAYVTTTIVVSDPDPTVADAQGRLIEKTLQGRDFTVKVETVNAVEAWLGTLPGQVYANVRSYPLSTLNLAHILPVSAVWAGPERDDHLAGPPLLQAVTDGSTPFRWSLHVGDVGHTLVVGPTGAGKSVLLAIMALQFRRYPGAQVFAFDYGGSLRAATLGMAGDWHDLGIGGEGGDEDTDRAVSLQPLARIGDPEERAWAADWLAALFGREGVPVTPDLKVLLWSALTSLASAPIGERTLTGLGVLLQSAALKAALQPYTLAGPWGRLLDGDQETLGDPARLAGVQTFETEGLIGAPAAPAVLAYLFHRIEARLDGRPTLVLIDEGWLALDDPAFADQLKVWLKTLRKKNASVVFATQSLADIDASPLAPALIESCPTRILLPNPRAREPRLQAVYARFGLNARQIQRLAEATPKRDYYLQSRLGDRLFDLGLGPVALAVCGASGKSDQALIAAVWAEAGLKGFAAAWLRRRGLVWAADLLADAPTPEPALNPEPVP
ncbi:conjugal transfer protein TrbE [Brevundimonas sp. LM2]|uniref:conjugal transfer protein TrbE n=1 Tax=Brevundimonas sp. LM2 TaxID=1938605 RepID=UPI000983AE20|nr:conjugal transfer protein TrbE [Brevundimonas sp. LM2]AQR61696.1 conjugal transfer protein TrbE [Brevundimonas sp. LM2]